MLQVLALLISSFIIESQAFNVKHTHGRARTTQAMSLRMISTSGDDFDSSVPSESDDLLKKILYTKSLVPSIDQTRVVLNNIKYYYDYKSLGEAFFDRISKQEALPGFKSMYIDHPLQNLKLDDVEKLFLSQPHVVEALTGIKLEAFTFKSVPNIQPGGLKLPEVDMKPLLGALLALSAAGVAMESAGLDVTTFIIPSLLSAAAAYVLDRQFLFNGVFKRSLGWVAASVEHAIPSKRDISHRHMAATFLVAYFTGIPVLSFNPDPKAESTRLKSVYPDAPRIEMNDPSFAVLEKRGKVTLPNLQRTVATQAAYMAIDLMDGRTADVSSYLRVLMAALFEVANNSEQSTLVSSDFSTYILPSLLLWGVLESLLILQESKSCFAAVLDVVENGGNVGDAVAAVEKSLAPDHNVFRRRAIRLEEEAAAAKVSVAKVPKTRRHSEAIAVLLEAHAAETPSAAEHNEPHTLIAGTDRIYTREELILHPNPTLEDVRKLTQEVMQMRVNLDRQSDGRLPASTRSYLQRLAAEVNEAIVLVREGKAAVSKNAIESSLLENSILLREDAGLMDSQVPPVLRELSVPAIAYEELLVEINALNKVLGENAASFKMWWAYGGKRAFDKFTGMDVMTVIDHTWRAVKKSSEGAATEQIASVNQPGGLFELQRMLAVLKPTLDGITVTAVDEENDVLPPELVASLQSLISATILNKRGVEDSLRGHRGVSFSLLDDKISFIDCRIADIDGRIADIGGSFAGKE